MFTDRPYDGFSAVSTGLNCTLQASAQFQWVFSLAVSQHGPYLRSTRYARVLQLLPISTRVFTLQMLVLGDCQLFQAVVVRLSPMHMQQAAPIVFAYLMFEAYL